MVTQQEVIKKFVESLDKTNLRGTAAVDEAVRACSSFTSYSDLMEHFLADRNNASSGDDFLKRYCGINLDNTDTGAITGADAGGKTVKTAESIVPEFGSSTSVYPPSNSFSYKGLTVNVPDASTLNDAQKNIIAGLYTWWLKSALDLIESTYNISFEDSDVSLKKITIDFNMGSYSYLNSYGEYTHSGGKTTGMTFHINSSRFGSLTNNDVNGIGEPDNMSYLDRVISSGLSKWLIMGKIDYEFDLPSTIGKGLDVLVDGYDDKGKNEITELVDDVAKLQRYSISNSNLDTGIHNDNKYDFAMGYMLLRYLAKQETDPTNVGDTTIPRDALEYNGHSYYLYSGVATTWEEAQIYCQSLGGHLAVINDSAENTALFNYMKSTGYNSAYFGLSDAIKEGTWKWVDGSKATYTNWASGEPNSERSNEDYAEFYYKFTDGKWNDGNFNQGTVGDSNVFICEWDTLKSSGTDTKVSNIGTAIIDALKSMNNDEFKDFINKIKNVANGITKAGDMEIPSLGSKPFKISGIIGDTIEYLQNLQHLIFHSSETGLSASANIEKLASSSIKEFASIYDLLNEFSSATNTSIWGVAAEKNIQVLTLASDLLSVRASITAVNANYEEEGIKAAILSCGEVFKNLGKTANDLYKSKITKPTKKGPWNAVDFYAALMNSAWGIFEQSYKSHQKYYADGKWNLEDTARLLMDVSISGLYGITHTLFEENDDLLWDLFLGDSYEGSGMTYPERLSAKLADISGAIGDAIGRFGLNVATGLQDLWNQLKSFQYGVGVGLGVVFGVGSIISKVLLGSKSVTYLAENGEVLSSSKNATASITMDKGKATFKTLKNVKQNLSLGSQKDTMEWTINTKDGNDDIIISSIKNTTVNSGGGNDTIFIKGTGDAYVDAGNGNDIIDGSTGNDILKGGKGNDIISGGSGNDTLTGGSGNDTFVYESGNDVIADYFTGENTIKLITGSVINASLKNSDVILKTSTGSITVKKGKGKKITVIDGNGNITTEYYGMLNYSSDKKTVTLNSAFSASLKAEDYATTVTKIDASAVAKSINIVGNAQNNTILGSNKAETIYGGSGNDSILGNAGNDKLYGDSGADSLNGGKGNDTLTGGTGKDIFLYASGEGNDVIADFTVGQDKIKITSGKISSASLKSSDIVFKIGNGTLTVKNGKNKELAIGNAIYYNNLTYDTNKTAVTLGSGFSGSLKSTDYATTAKTINASSVTKSINIIGNSQDNTIIGSAKAETIYGGTGNDSIVGNAGNDKLYGDAGNDKLFGGEGNDTLNGGAGNDTLTGGNGKDVFAYEGGNDVITDYSAGQDTIKINNGKITKTSYSGNSVVFSVGSGSITVQNGKGKKIAITDSNNKTTTQIYNQDVSYVSAKTSSNGRWFTEDDNNFITDDIQISEITQETESNYVTEQTEIFKKANEFDVTDSIVSTVNLVKK